MHVTGLKWAGWIINCEAESRRHGNDRRPQFNGDGTLSTPTVTVANPFGDTGAILQPPAGGAAGEYTINDDCTGTVRFSDAAGVTFSIVVDPPKGDTVWMIQTVPANNVFQGSAKRVF